MTTKPTNWKTIPRGTPVLFRRSKDSEYEEGTWIGGADYGMDAGAFCWDVNDVSGYLNRSVGARVDQETGAWYIEPFWCKLKTEVVVEESPRADVNWSDVKTGTHIYVRDYVSQHWMKRQFIAVHVSGGFLTYAFNSDDPDSIEHWDYAELILSVSDLKQTLKSEFVNVHCLYMNGQLLWEQALKMFADIQAQMPPSKGDHEGDVV